MGMPDEIKQQLEAEVEALKSVDTEEVETEEVVEETEEVEAEEVESEEVEETSDNPPGFISYEDWVAQGKDPNDWRGANAYKREYDRIQEVKELSSKMTDLVSLIEDEKKTAAQKAREEERARFEAELNEAKENMDVDRVEELLKKAPAEETPKQEFKEPAPIADFRKANPILDPNSQGFDQDFETAVAGVVNSRLQAFGGAVTEDLMSRVMKAAFDEVKGLYPEKFESPKNTRKTVAKTTAAKKTPRFQEVEADLPGGGKASSKDMLNFFIRKYGKDHPTTQAFKKSMEA